ncbi:MAG: molybdopterin-guanine dinucleotide biosynthesis protein B [Desulfosalsimonadaceae bacterium]
MAAIAGFSNSGKTTLLEKLIREMTRRGLHVGTIKHDVHGFEMDRKGKDTWRHKQAGASTTIISSPRQIGMVKDVDHDHDPLELAALMPDIDLILLEGYKSADIPKIEIFRSAVSRKLFCTDDPKLMAVITDSSHDVDVPCFGHEDISDIADFLIRKLCVVSSQGQKTDERYLA